MKKTFAWGFDNKCNPEILRRLEKDGVIDLRFWIKQIREKPFLCKAEVKCYDDFFTLYDFRADKSAPVWVLQKLESRLLDFLMMNARHQVNHCSSETLISRQTIDDINLFYRLVSYFYEKITEHGIEQLIFANIVHEGADFVAYHLAKALDIPVLLFYQSLFPNRFFCVDDIDQMGRVMASRPVMSDPARISVSSLVEEPLFYMTKIQGAEWHLENLEDEFSLSKNIKKNKWAWIFSLLLNRFGYVEKKCQEQGRRLRRTRLKQYIDDVSVRTEKNVDFGCDYVYVPLQLQPELTTATLGGPYVDQVKVIEEIAAMVPSSYTIYVKENPKQWEAMRPRDHFERLSQIKQVKLLGTQANSHQLIEHAKFIGVVTTTAGWEAILRGKPVLSFGRAWFNDLPGVFKIDDRPSLDDLLSCKIDSSHLQSEFDALTSRMGLGILDRDYATIYPEFNESENVKAVASFI
ncbi:MAG: hypothetical protein ACI9BD_001001, partial [Candidatus Marinamargulisbacteria bacterium]